MPARVHTVGCCFGIPFGCATLLLMTAAAALRLGFPELFPF